MRIVQVLLDTAACPERLRTDEACFPLCRRKQILLPSKEITEETKGFVARHLLECPYLGLLASFTQTGFGNQDKGYQAMQQTPRERTPESPPGITSYDPSWSPAYLSNGLVGLRVREIPGIDGACNVGGYAGIHPVEKVQAWLPAPYPLAFDLKMDHWWMTARRERVSFVGQSHDFSSGELSTHLRYRTEDNAAELTFLTFCSRSLPTVVLQELRLEVAVPGSVQLKALIRTEGVAGMLAYRGAASVERPAADGSLEWESPGGETRVGMAHRADLTAERPDGTLCPLTVERMRDEAGYRNDVSTTWSFDAQPGMVYVLRQYAGVVPSTMVRAPERAAVRMVCHGWERGFERLRAENRHAWREIWRGSPVIHGAEPKWQGIADACYYYLHTSIHPSSSSATGLLGLSAWRNYHYFLGHVFWDIDVFAFPPLLLTAPDTARVIPAYRFARKEAAAMNAKLNGHRGLQFPWESDTQGEEATPVQWTNALYEQHISMDVAHAFCQYVHATGDEAFEREMAWPIVQGVAEFIASRAERTERGYEIRRVTGVSEGTICVDNNAYTNVSARIVLEEAVAMADRIGMKPPEAWKRIADAMYLPIDPATQVLEQYEGALEKEKLLCLESLMAFFPWPLRLSSEVQAATYAHYLGHARETAGWPMVPPLYGVFAARTGDRAFSKELFERGVADYMMEPFRLIDEFGCTMSACKEKVGPYLAHAGGFILDLLFGLPGLQLDAGDPENWFKHDVVMPEGWDGITVERIWVRGRPARLVAMHGMARARIEYLDAVEEGEAGRG